MIKFNKYFYEYDKQRILNSLPLRGDKTQGKTRKEIVKITSIKPEVVSRRLQTLKRQHKVRCYQRKWRCSKAF